MCDCALDRRRLLLLVLLWLVFVKLRLFDVAVVVLVVGIVVVEVGWLWWWFWWWWWWFRGSRCYATWLPNVRSTGIVYGEREKKAKEKNNFDLFLFVVVGFLIAGWFCFDGMILAFWFKFFFFLFFFFVFCLQFIDWFIVDIWNYITRNQKKTKIKFTELIWDK